MPWPKQEWKWKPNKRQRAQRRKLNCQPYVLAAYSENLNEGGSEGGMKVECERRCGRSRTSAVKSEVKDDPEPTPPVPSWPLSSLHFCSTSARMSVPLTPSPALSASSLGPSSRGQAAAPLFAVMSEVKDDPEDDDEDDPEDDAIAIEEDDPEDDEDDPEDDEDDLEDEDMTKLSHNMAAFLRHTAHDEHLLGDDGWIALEDALPWLDCTAANVEQVVKQSVRHSSVWGVDARFELCIAGPCTWLRAKDGEYYRKRAEAHIEFLAKKEAWRKAQMARPLPLPPRRVAHEVRVAQLSKSHRKRTWGPIGGPSWANKP